MNALAEDNKLSIESLSALEKLVRERQLQPIVITGHTGWSDDLDFVFAHTDCVCHATKNKSRMVRMHLMMLMMNRMIRRNLHRWSDCKKQYR